MPGQHASEAARRAQILKAAYRVSSAHGLDGLTVRGVASRAGISTGLVIFHFESKDRLVMALLDWLLETTTALHITDDVRRVVAATGLRAGIVTVGAEGSSSACSASLRK